LSPEDAAARTLTDIEEAKVAQGRTARVVGSPARVRDGLVALAQSYGVNELMLLTVCHDPAARRRSYELLAEALEG
jgi:alkanesulfonate monooxygenase SsuD/methylene tetrahydromethanopterin reductase-like flavin-dependent oxidoreductase (luciferase family)